MRCSVVPRRPPSHDRAWVRFTVSEMAADRYAGSCMTVIKSVHSGRVIPLPRSDLVRADPGGAIGAPWAPSNSNDLQNVVPFLRPRAAEAHAPAVVLPGDVVQDH